MQFPKSFKLFAIACSVAVHSAVAASVAANVTDASRFTPQIVKVIDYESYIAGSAAKVVGRDIDAAKLTKRQVGNAVVCRASFFRDCVLIVGVPSGLCVPLGRDLDNLVSSFGPDGGQDAYVFDRIDCVNNRETLGPIRAPGVEDFNIDRWFDSNAVGHANFNDRMSSYQLFY